MIASNASGARFPACRDDDRALTGVIAEDAPNRTLRDDGAKNPANPGFATIDFAGLS